MGILGGNFAKPGKGITKEEAEKRNYFDILGCHIWDLMKLNLLFILVNIVLIGAFIFIVLPYFVNLEETIDMFLKMKYIILPPWPFIPFMFMGPSIAGLTYVLRNWSRQEHAFLFSDFFEYMKKNWKQGLALSVISTVVTYLFLNAVLFYISAGVSVYIVLTIALILGIILFSMGFYTYPMVVTFDMKLKDIIKNAFIFALVKLPQNIFFLIIIGAVHLLLLYYFPIIWVILMLIFLISWTGFTMNYYAWHIMNKYMISQLPAEEKQDEAVFQDVK